MKIWEELHVSEKVRKVECYMQVLSRVTAIVSVRRLAKLNCYKIEEDEKLISQNDISIEYSILSLYENVTGALASQICIDFIQNPNQCMYRKQNQ